MKQQQGAPIIIGGFYRSGTSLVRRLLDSHPNIYCGPEVKFFRDFFGNYINDPLANLRFFSSARTMGIEENQLLDIFGDAFIKAHELAMKLSGKRRWADKNPENLIYLEQWHYLLDGNYKFVHVVRNPLDTLASLNEAGFWKAIPEAFEKKVELYRVYLESAQNFQNKSGIETLVLRYEDLVSSPQDTLTTLLSQLDEVYDKRMLERFYDNNRRSGIEDSKVSRTRSIQGDSINRWKKDLSAEEQQLTVERLQCWFRIFGYSDML